MPSLRKKPHKVRLRQVGIYVFESRHAEGFTMARERWEYDKLCLILRGAGTLETEAEAQPVQVAQLVFLPAGSLHRFADQPGNPLVLVMCCFDERVFATAPVAQAALRHFRQHFPRATPFPLPDKYHRVEVMDGLRRMIFEQVRKPVGYEAQMWCELLALLILPVRLHDERQRQTSADTRARAFSGCLTYLHNNFYRPIKVHELAEIAGLSYRGFTEYFKAQTGQTVIAYLTNIRVEHAQKLLTETGDILYAAYESGFGDLAHFYRVFKARTGKSPGEFLQHFRSE